MPLLDISTFAFTREAQILLWWIKPWLLFELKKSDIWSWLDDWTGGLHCMWQDNGERRRLCSPESNSLLSHDPWEGKGNECSSFPVVMLGMSKPPKEDTWREFLLSAFPSPLCVGRCHLIAQDNNRLHSSGYPNIWHCEVTLALADTGKHHSYPGIDEEAEHMC